jgi:hypothetical protein
MIENKANPDEGFEKDGLKIRWTVENGLGLVFVVSFFSAIGFVSVIHRSKLPFL